MSRAIDETTVEEILRVHQCFGVHPSSSASSIPHFGTCDIPVFLFAGRHGDPSPPHLAPSQAEDARGQEQVRQPQDPKELLLSTSLLH